MYVYKKLVDINLSIIILKCLYHIYFIDRKKTKRMNRPYIVSRNYVNAWLPHITMYLEIFARQNFRELPAKLKFRVFIFANGDLIIYISYIADVFVLQIITNGKCLRIIYL